jgi:integrase/recombinase XerD
MHDLERVVKQWRILGLAPRSIFSYRHWTLQVLHKALVSDYRDLSADRVVRLARSFARIHHHCSPESTRRNWLAAFRAFAWGLERLGKAVGAVNLPSPAQESDPVLTAFAHYGQRLGWSKRTLDIRRVYLRYLRRFLTRRQAPWPAPRLIDLDGFLHQASRSWKRTTVSGAASTFRAWLHFLFVTGRTKHDLASSVALPRSIPFPKPVRALPWTMVRQLRRGIDRSTALGRRDYAQYLLLCAYGLGNAEIITLKLEQIDWASGVLHIRRVKSGTTLDLPLLPTVAQAIAVYLRRGRPQTISRNVFVRHKIPFGPLSRTTVGQRVRCWAERAEVDAPFLGTHLFRHSHATRQLEKGTSLKVIGDLLGHRSCQTTRIYVRTALSRLRQLALPVPNETSPKKSLAR